MLIKNNGVTPVTMNLRDGTSYLLAPGVPTSVPDAATTMIDDSAYLIGLFNAGTLTVTTDAGGAFSGFPTTVNASDSAVGKLLQVHAKVGSGGARTLVDSTGQAVGSGGSKTDRVKAALRVSSAAAFDNNIRTNVPWFVPRTIARNTYYSARSFVVGDDGVSVYYCGQSGVTASTGTLTGGTNRRAITDGTAKFSYAGTTAQSVYGIAQDVITVATRAAGIPAGAKDVTPTRANNPLSITAGRLVWNTAYGRDWLSARGPHTGVFGSVQDPNVIDARGGFAFETDSDYVIHTSINEASLHARCIYEVNGRLVQLGELSLSANGGGVEASKPNPGVFKLDLSRWGGVGVWKRVRVHMCTDLTVGWEWFINPRSQIRPWSAPSQIITTLEGDSIGATGFGFNDWLHNAMDWLGQNRSINLAIGATGFESNNVGNGTYFYQRIPTVLDENPDLHIIGGNHNGGSTVAPTDPKSFASYMSTLRADSRGADLPVLVFGTMRLEGETNATAQVWENQLAAAHAAYVAASGDSNVWMFRGLTAPTPWSEGNGRIDNQLGFNSDYFFDTADYSGSGAHPNVTFNRHWGYMVARSIRDWANS